VLRGVACPGRAGPWLTTDSWLGSDPPPASSPGGVHGLTRPRRDLPWGAGLVPQCAALITRRGVGAGLRSGPVLYVVAVECKPPAGFEPATCSLRV
jgi:hypothetical protein